MREKLPSLFRVSQVFFFIPVGELPEGFRHVQKSRLVHRICDALGKPYAFRGVSTVIDNGKWRHTTLPRRCGKAAHRYFVPQQIFLTKLWKNEVPTTDVAAS
jgi:hypothetical protein